MIRSHPRTACWGTFWLTVVLAELLKGLIA
jgi:hypothetical protein